jgi:hypothetical protein
MDDDLLDDLDDLMPGGSN